MDPTRDRLRVMLLGSVVEAVLRGHDIEPWTPVQGSDSFGYEARCRRCGMFIYTSSMMMLSYLADRCPVADEELAC
ncbi:MAG TPA: hypothetical protein VFI27_10100 [candidate division Zixibacteria bacterium]|nr:hypothetical protein [candidate division Zixibacteria bacterium]